MNTYYIPIILGTKRPGRQSLYPAKLIAKIGDKHTEIETELIDPLDFDMPKDGDNDELKDSKYSDITKRADGFFIVTPEYNHGYPGSLKRLLDSEYDSYNKKPVALAGVSSGSWGGVRAVNALLPVLRTMGMITIQRDLYFPNIEDLFDKKGNITDKKYISRIKKSYDELLWMVKTLAWGKAQF